MLDLRIGSLFSGLGGLELGLELAGCGRTVWQCESCAECRVELAKRWPGVPVHPDVRGFGPGPGSADVVCGGFPCQPFSQAGPQVGWEDPRALWPHFRRIVCQVRPRFVVAENVQAFLNRGLDRVLWDLASMGYDAEWGCLRACESGAPHPRPRVFVLAYANGQRPEAAHDWQGATREDEEWEPAPPQLQWDNIEPWPGAHGGWQAPPALPRVADGLPGDAHACEAYGNAVVPQVAGRIGRRIVSIVKGGAA